MSGEFALIARHFAPLAAGLPGAWNLTDDAAALAPAPGHEFVVTTDCMVAGVHFLDADGPDAIARKLLRVNLSDLAAMGARPVAYFLALALPRTVSEAWLAAFAAALGDDQRRYGVTLAGGDTTATPDRLVATITALGEVPAGQALRRAGAQPGDDLYVSGTIGDAALGLAVKLGTLQALAAPPLLMRLHYPEPRIALGQKLRGVATACLDVSDGLVQDAGHIAEVSAVAVRIEAAAVPLSPAAALVVEDDPARLAEAITGGDDYELVFTAPPARAAAVAQAAAAAGTPVTRIGQIAAGSGVTVLDAQGQVMRLARAGWQHF